MKAKLVKYPFDEKKYRWDTWYQGKEFEYFWDESLPNNFETIEPYIKTETYEYDDDHLYSYADIRKEPIDFSNLPATKNETAERLYPVNTETNLPIYKIDVWVGDNSTATQYRDFPTTPLDGGYLRRCKI